LESDDENCIVEITRDEDEKIINLKIICTERRYVEQKMNLKIVDDKVFKRDGRYIVV